MSSKLLAPVRGWEARRALRAARRRADGELIATRHASPRLAWRVEELVSEQNRVALGRSVTDVVHAADERLLPSAVPIDRPAVRSARAQLLELASQLYDLSRPVAPRGILLAERLLVDGAGPLYGHRAPGRLGNELVRVLAALRGDDVPAR